MRPPRRILLIDPDDDRRGELKFILEVHGYRVIQHARGEINLILARWPISAGSCKKLKTANPEVPLVILHAPIDVLNPRSPMISHSDAVWTASMPRFELLQRIRVISARKRGPRKGYRKPPQPETVPAEAAATA